MPHSEYGSVVHGGVRAFPFGGGLVSCDGVQVSWSFRFFDSGPNASHARARSYKDGDRCQPKVATASRAWIMRGLSGVFEPGNCDIAAAIMGACQARSVA